MSTQAQIEADAALARRLQEEEFATQLPHLDWTPAPPSSSTPPTPHRHLPSYPQPAHEWPQPSHSPPPAHAHGSPDGSRDARFPFVPRRTSFGAADVLSDLFRHITESGDGRRAAATDGLSDLGDFPGSTFVRRDEFRRRAAAAAGFPGAAGPPPPPPPHTRPRRGGSSGGGGSSGSGGTPSSSSADGVLNSILQETFGRMDDGMFSGGGSFMVTPDGVQFEHVRGPGGARVTFVHGRETRRARGHGASGGDGSGGGGGGGTGGQPERGRMQFGDAGDMMNLLFSGTFGPLTALGGAGGAGGGGAATFGEWFRSMMPGAMDGGETYEDWLNVIERMGGNVNRGGTDAEIERLPTHRFEGEAQTEQGADGAEKCAICLGEYEDGDEVKVLPCAHRFHSECVDQWLRVNRICPFCKQSIRDGDGARGRRASSG